jgi:predicted RNase H-like nuclease (RuvC/YqgF family)
MCANRSQGKSIERAKQPKTSVSKCKQAIYQVEEEIQSERMKIERLERAIEVFKQMEADGAAWPGESATQN